MGTLILCYFRCPKTTEIIRDGFGPISNMPGIFCAISTFSYKKLAMWVHLFLINFNDLQSFLLCFSLKCLFLMIIPSLSGNIIYMRLPLIKGLDAIQPGLNHFISMIIFVASCCGFQPQLYFLRLKGLAPGHHSQFIYFSQ